jgi:hypothetical protein
MGGALGMTIGATLAEESNAIAMTGDFFFSCGGYSWHQQSYYT